MSANQCITKYEVCTYFYLFNSMCIYLKEDETGPSKKQRLQGRSSVLEQVGPTEHDIISSPIPNLPPEVKYYKYLIKYLIFKNKHES